MMRRPRVPRPPCATEHQEQVALCCWLDHHRIVYLAVPNAGMRSYRMAARMKAEGLRAGAPDLLVLSRPRDASIRGVAIELKRQRGGRVTPLQLAWQEAMRTCGWYATIARGANEAIEQLEALGYGRVQV